MKNIYILCLFLLISSGVFSQSTPVERDRINLYTIEANKLIWHINLNIKNLSVFQEKLNAWYVNSSKGISQAPSFVYAENLNAETMVNLLSDPSVEPSNPAFNYLITLKKLNKQILLFNTFCRELQKKSKTGTKDDYYSKAIIILHQIDAMTPDMVNLSYDFSLSCAINFGKEKLPVELDRLKNTVGQAKNVIMAIRENSPIQVKSYLNQLNVSINASRMDDKFNDLRRVGKFDLEESEIIKIHAEILDASNKIAFWAEQYLQSNYTEAEVEPILSSAILAFNVFEGKAGCSGAYNELIGQSTNQYLFYTEEPMFFDVNEKDKVKVNNQIIGVKKDTVVIGSPNPQQVVKVDSIKEPVKLAPVFNAKDISTLDGALPNNITIMMDVSASMKMTGKLPLLKSSIRHLFDIMREEDRISLIAYSGKAELLIADAGIHNRAEVLTLLDTLHSSGGTDILNGVNLAYKTAMKSYMDKGNNRIIIATDGEFGVRPDLIKVVQSKAVENIVLSVFHFVDDKTTKTSTNKGLLLLSLNGKGNYKVINDSDEALQILMEEVKKN